MFLNWPESLGLLNSRNDTNILGLFPYPVRKTVVSAVVERLEDTANCSPKIFATPAHAKWLMEVVAQGFTLHMEDLPIIEKCVATYTKWLLGGPDDKPPGLVAEETFFRGEMLGHLTFLFEPRSGTSDTALTVQTRLCKDVLDNIILAAAHKLRGVITPAIWDIWIRLLIGVVDSIFMNKAKTTPPMHQLLVKSLSAPAFRVLLEVLLLSQNRDPEIWNSVVGLAVNWIRVSTVQHWCSAVNALTLRVLALMYGPKFGGTSANHLLIDWIVEDKGSVKSQLTLEHDFVFFAWRRMVALLPEPHTMTEPEVHRMFFSGISRMVDHYLKVTDYGPHCPRASKQKLPNGNTILALVGRWLFNALLTDRPGFEDGTAFAAATACKLFCRTPATTSEPPFQREHLSSFYAALSRILIKTHTDKVLLTVLMSTKNFFLREYSGSELLIPHFLYAGASLWRETGTDPNVRASFIELVSSLCCIADHFTDTKIVSKLSFEIAYGTSQRVSPVVAQFTTLRQHFQVLFSTAITKEENPRNIVRLLSVIVAFLHDYSKALASNADQETYILFTSSTINEIVRKCREVWSPEVIVHAYTALSAMAELTPHMGSNASMICKLILFSIAEHLSTLTSNPAKPEERDAQDKIIHRALLTLSDWWMTDPNLPTLIDSKTIQSAIKAIVGCLGLPGKSYSAPPLVKGAAEFALYHFTTSSSFPHPVGPQRVSSEIAEEDIMKQIPNLDTSDIGTSQYLRYFMLDESIIMCIIDVPKKLKDPNPTQEPQDCDVYIVLRDSMGRHVWKTKPTYYEREEALNPPYDNQPASSVTKEPVIKDRYELSIQTELYSDLLNYLNSLRSDRLYPGSLISYADSFVALEKSHLQTSSYHLDSNVRFKLPEYKSPYDSSSLKFHFGRVLVSNLGLAHPDTYGRLVPLDARPGFAAALRGLDSTQERSVMSVGVVLIQQPPKKAYDFLSDESAGPQDFQDFLTSLGWGINLWDHTGYRGPLVAASTGDYAPYFASYSTEVIFPVANWIPNSDNFEATVAKKRKVLAAGPVQIIWSLCGEYEAPLTQREFLHIVIHPLKSGLYRIRLVTRENRPPPVGPLTDNMKLSRRVLGPMVRMTAMAATRHLQPESSILAPGALRRSKIEEFAKSYQRPMAFDDWMTNLVSSRFVPETSIPTPSATATTPVITKLAVDTIEPSVTTTVPITPSAALHNRDHAVSASIVPLSTGSSVLGSPQQQHPPTTSNTASGLNSSPPHPIQQRLFAGSSAAPLGGAHESTTTAATMPTSSSPTITPAAASPKTPLLGSGSGAPAGNVQMGLSRTTSTSMPSSAPPPTPALPSGGLGQSSGSSNMVGSPALAIPGSSANGMSRTSAPPSPRAMSPDLSSSEGDNRNRLPSASEGSESGDSTPTRSLSISSGGGYDIHSSDGLYSSDGHSSSGATGQSGGIAGRVGSVSTGPIPSAYKGPPIRTPPPAYNPQISSSAGIPASTPGSSAPSSPGGSLSHSQGSAGGSYGSVGPSATPPLGQTRKPSSGFGAFWKKDKDKEKEKEKEKEKKPEEKKDPKKK